MTRAQSCSIGPRRPRAGRLAAALVASLAALACSAPAPALGAGEPVITAAAIDNQDRLAVTWRMEAGTTFSFLEFSTVAVPNPFIPGAFAGGNRPRVRPDSNVVAEVCAAPGANCTAPPLLTAFVTPGAVARDRRYFVKVSGVRSGRRAPLTSEVWVIDGAKPIRPGSGRPASPPTNKPVLGRAYKPPNPRTMPRPRLTVPKPPKTIAAVLRDGVSASIDCPEYVCYALVGLHLGKTRLVLGDTTARPDVRERFILRPTKARRAALQRRRRARLQVRIEIYQPGGKLTRASRSFTVRR